MSDNTNSFTNGVIYGYGSLAVGVIILFAFQISVTTVFLALCTPIIPAIGYLAVKSKLNQ